MGDLISRDFVLSEYDRQHKGPPGGARKIMEEAPAVDAAPVVHARWQMNKYDAMECSACHMLLAKTRVTGATGHIHFIHIMTAYCSHCGAKMEWGGQDGE